MIVHYNNKFKYPTYPSFHLSEGWTVITLRHYVGEGHFELVTVGFDGSEGYLWVPPTSNLGWASSISSLPGKTPDSEPEYEFERIVVPISEVDNYPNRAPEYDLDESELQQYRYDNGGGDIQISLPDSPADSVETPDC